MNNEKAFKDLASGFKMIREIQLKDKEQWEKLYRGYAVFFCKVHECITLVFWKIYLAFLSCIVYFTGRKVCRQAHNLKVVGLNPVPQPKFIYVI